MFTGFGTISHGPHINRQRAVCAQESPISRLSSPTDFGWAVKGQEAVKKRSKQQPNTQVWSIIYGRENSHHQLHDRFCLYLVGMRDKAPSIAGKNNTLTQEPYLS